jgi:ribosomal protein S16
LHLDDSAIYNELLGSYTPAPPKMEDPTQLNPDVQYQVEDQIAKAVPTEQARRLLRQYIQDETKLEA